MWFLILFSIVGLEEYIRRKFPQAMWRDGWGRVESFMRVLFSFLVLITIVGVVTVSFVGVTHGISVAFVGPLQDIYDYNIEIDKQAELVALSNQMSIQGQFFLGTGRVDGKMKYTYIKKLDQGVKLKSADAEDYIVKQKEGANPRIYERTKVVNPRNLMELFWSQNTFANFYSQKFIVIPEGSVKHGFSIST